jgi:hypothetical protein
MDITYPYKEIAVLDPTSFMECINNLPENEWDKYTDRQDRFKAHEHTKTLPGLIAVRDSFPEITIEDNPLTETLKPHWAALVDKFCDLNETQYLVTMAVVVKLSAGYEIEQHTDVHPYFALTHRLHWCLSGDYESMDFMVAGNKVPMGKGSVVEINNRLPHRVMYTGKEPRYNLIIDLFRVE